ncbi:MAG: S-layer homology domain-containing protein [Solirubrobacterales bacterium]
MGIRKVFKARKITATAAVLLVFGLLLILAVNPALAAAFSDVKADNPAAPYYSYVAARGMMNGYPDGSFRPDKSMTRAEIAAMLVHAKGLKPYTPKKATFKDVNPKHWAFSQIEAANRAGLLKGYANGTFRPNQPVTRAETAALLLKLTSQTSPALALSASVKDVKPDSWAIKSIATVLDAGIMKTVAPGSFAPDRPATRGQVARGMAAMLTMAPEFYQVDLPTVVVPVKGNVTVAERGKAEKAITNETSCLPGATIKTGDNTEVQVKFPDGSNFLLKDNTELIIEAARGQSIIKKDGTPGTVVDSLNVKLPKGKLFGALAASYLFSHTEETGSPDSASAEASKPSDGAARLFAQGPAETDKSLWYKEASAKRTRVRVDMPWGVAGIRGCIWANAVTSAGQTTSVAEGGSGDVSVSSGGGSVDVGTGQSTTTAGANTPPSAPAPLSPSEKTDFAQQQSWVQETLAVIAQNAPAPEPASVPAEDEPNPAEQPAAPDPAAALQETLSQVQSTVDQSAGVSSDSNISSTDTSKSGTTSYWGGSGSGGGGESATVTPVITLGAIPTKTLALGKILSVPITVSPSDATITASSSAPGIVSCSTAGSWLSLSGTTYGMTTITVTATKAGFASAEIKFTAVCTTLVEGGTGYSLALPANGQVWAWGANTVGQLGDTGTSDRTTPRAVAALMGGGHLNQAISVCAGPNHGLAVNSDGSVYAWGKADSGQLGNGTDTLSYLRNPIKVLGPGGSGFLTDIQSVAAGAEHSLALKYDGTVWAWGANTYGQLGDGSINGSSYPVQVRNPAGTGPLTHVVALAAGDFHSLALLDDGTVLSWGYNPFGQLGNNDSGTDKLLPVQVLQTGAVPLTGVKTIASGYAHGLALKSDGSIWAWGYNFEGALGNGGVTGSQVANPVSGATGTYVAIAAGYGHSLALRDDNTVWAWGSNGSGQLGLSNTTAGYYTPQQVRDDSGSTYLTGILSIAAGGSHSLAAKADGTVFAWGENANGAAGNNSTTNPLTKPVYTFMKGVSMADDGALLEGQENGEIITVNAFGTTWAADILSGSWTLTGIPLGVSVSAVTRVSDTVVTISLAGNRTADYDVPKIPVLTVPASALTGITDPLEVNGGTCFQADNPTLTLSSPTIPYPIAFTAPGSVSNAKLFGFRLDKSPGFMPLNLYIGVSTSGMTVIGDDYSGLKLAIDLNDNGVFEAAEEITQSGTGGTISNNGQAITVTHDGGTSPPSMISVSGLAVWSNNHDYMIIGNVANLATGDQVTLSIATGGSTAKEQGATDPTSVTVIGSNVTGVTHTCP